LATERTLAATDGDCRALRHTANEPPPPKAQVLSRVNGPQGARRVLMAKPSLAGVEPKLVAEITYLTWTADNLLRHTVYIGLREDKPAEQVRRETARA